MKTFTRSATYRPIEERGEIITLMMVKTDSQIHDTVIQELKWDTQVDETEVGVESTRGAVTLSGRGRNGSGWKERSPVDGELHGSLRKTLWFAE